MGSAHSRGQGAIEILVILLLLTSLILAALEFSEAGARLFNSTQLSKEIR